MKKILFALAAALFVFTGCVQDGIFEGPSTIEQLVLNPENPTSITPVTVTITVSGLQAVKEATIKYNGQTVNMTGSGSSFSGVIPALPDGTEVNIVVTVVNEAGYTTTYEKSYKVGDPATDWSKLKFNEVSGSGADEEKFFELYNGSDFPIKLTGVTINKDGSLTWTGIASEEIPAHGVFAIIGAKGTTDRGFSSGFSAKKNVRIELFKPDGEMIDFFQRGVTPEDGSSWGDQKLSDNSGSWSRIPDGTGKWMTTATKTPGALNDSAGVEDADIVQ